MALFNKALNLVLKHEGGYVNNPADKGGETYQGIARNFHSWWQGWSFLDQITNKKRFDYFPELAQLVSDFYRAQFWDKYKLSGIKEQETAELVFDWLVNSGKAGREIQKVLVSMGQKIAIDNYIGAQTVAAINAVNQNELINKIVAARKSYYISGVNAGWLDSQFLSGLLNRADSFARGVVDEVGKRRKSTV